MRRKTDLLLIIGLALLLGAAAVLVSEWGAVMHLSDHEEYEKKQEVRSVLITGTGRMTVLFSDAEADAPGRFIHRLKLDLYPQTDRPLELTVTVHTEKAGENGKETSSVVIKDVNPLYVTTEILKLDLEHVVSVDLESAGRAPFSVGTVQADNHFYFNRYLFGFTVLAACAVLFALYFAVTAGLGKNTAKAKDGIRILFTASALVLGLSLVLCLPRNKVGYDEETHLQAVLEMASFPSGELHISRSLLNQLTVTEYNNPSAQPGGAQEQDAWNTALSKDVDYKLGQKTPDFSVLWNRVPAYLVMAVFMKAGKGLSLPWTSVVALTRLGNLLMYVALIWFALKVLPFGHWLMALIALFPQNLFLAATVSYDPFVTGCLYIGMAYTLKLMFVREEKKKLYADLVLMLVFYLLGCLPKAVYAPLMLTAILIPFRRTQNRRQRTVFGIVIAGAAMLTLALFILPTVLSPSDTGDIRGGAVSELGQIGFILHKPFTYASILFAQMIRWLPKCCFAADCTVYLGHLVNGNTAYRGPGLLCAVLLFSAPAAGILTAAFRLRSVKLRMPERLWNLLLCFGASVLIWTAMYVAFTEPGAQWIAGVQGRYFIPLLFPLYLSLGAELPAETLSLPETGKKLRAGTQPLPEAGKKLPAGTQPLPVTGKKRPGGAQPLPVTGKELPAETLSLPETGKKLRAGTQPLAVTGKKRPGGAQPQPVTGKKLPGGTLSLPETGKKLPAVRLLVRRADLWYYITILGVIIAGAGEFLQAVVLPYCL